MFFIMTVKISYLNKPLTFFLSLPQKAQNFGVGRMYQQQPKVSTKQFYFLVPETVSGTAEFIFRTLLWCALNFVHIVRSSVNSTNHSVVSFAHFVQNSRTFWPHQSSTGVSITERVHTKAFGL
jgi:hypothetical protein